MSIIISALAIVVAAVAGGAAFWRAGKSNKTAADGLMVAKDSRHLATEANSLAKSANNIAEGAVQASLESANEARRSADVAERVEGRQTERAHVSWEDAGWDILSCWSIKNMGLDTAHEAYASLCIDDAWFNSRASEVHPNEAIRMDFSSKASIAAIATGELSQAMTASGIYFVLSKGPRVSYQITWRTAGGTWRMEKGGDA